MKGERFSEEQIVEVLREHETGAKIACITKWPTAAASASSISSMTSTRVTGRNP
jgi:hypothetical protein